MQYSGYMSKMGGNVAIRSKCYGDDHVFGALYDDALPGQRVAERHSVYAQAMHHGELAQLPDDVFSDDLRLERNLPTIRIAELPIGVIYGIISH